jgi:PAS domain S-box-containing protein
MKQPMRADPEQKYRTLYEFTSDAVMLLNGQSFFDCNPATLKMFGCATREQFLGKHPSEFSPEFQPGGQTSARLSQQRIETALQEGMCRFEWLHCRLDGSEFPAEVWLTAMDLGGEKVLQAVVRDITERKRAEEALREREEKYRTILETIQDGYYEVDIAGNLTFFNDSLCRLYGYSKDELMGMNYRRYMDDETAKAVYQTYNTVYRTGKPTEAFGCGIIRKDGTRGFVQVSVSLMRGSTGEPIGFRGIMSDITERKRVEEESRATRQRLSDIIDFLPDATSGRLCLCRGLLGRAPAHLD